MLCIVHPQNAKYEPISLLSHQGPNVRFKFLFLPGGLNSYLATEPLQTRRYISVPLPVKYIYRSSWIVSDQNQKRSSFIVEENLAFTVCEPLSLLACISRLVLAAGQLCDLSNSPEEWNGENGLWKR